MEILLEEVEDEEETGQGTRGETVQLWEEFMWHGVETFEPDALFLYSSLIKSSLIIFDGETNQPLVLELDGVSFE